MLKEIVELLSDPAEVLSAARTHHIHRLAGETTEVFIDRVRTIVTSTAEAIFGDGSTRGF